MSRALSSVPVRLTAAGGIVLVAAIIACSSSATTSSSTTTDGTSTVSGLQAAKWGTNVTVSYTSGSIRFQSNGLPNHARQAEYAVPNAGVVVPSATTAHAAADPTRAQTYDFQITTTPKKAATVTSGSLGTIGVMISGASLFNPYEGDGKTVALASNFTVKDSAGVDVAFLDACNGHPTPMGMYHYHGLPPCVTATVDAANGPSHIIGIAFDGFPIYGNRDINGAVISTAQLDQCNGITSATPEFPAGIYHYVLLDVPNASSSIKCFSGTVSTAAMNAAGMPPTMTMP
jgi:hypothetical protein